MPRQPRAAVGLLLGVAVCALVVTVRGTWPCEDMGEGAQAGSRLYSCQGIEPIIARALKEVVPDVGYEREVTYTEAFSEMTRMVPDLKMYLVGGPVRDSLRNWTPKDIDIAIETTRSTRPTEYVGKLIQDNYRHQKRAGRNPLLRVPNDKVNMGFLLLLGRQDEGIDCISTANNLDAANSWRDFTVNALYYDMQRNLVVDGTGKGVEDNSLKRLRMAGWEDPDAWCPYQVGRRGVNCPIKLQRYFHMRVKGFKPDVGTRDFVMGRLTSYLTDDRSIEQFLQSFVSKLCKSTLSSKITFQKRAARFQALIRAAEADYSGYRCRKGDCTIALEKKYKIIMRKRLLDNVAPWLYTSTDAGRGKICWRPTQGSAIVGLTCWVGNIDGETIQMAPMTASTVDSYEWCVSREFNRVKRCKFDHTASGKDASRAVLIEAMASDNPSCVEAVKGALVRVGTMDDKTLRSMQQLSDGEDEYGLDQQELWREHVEAWTQGLADNLLTYDGVVSIARLVAQRLLLHLHEFRRFYNMSNVRIGSAEVHIAGASGWIDEKGYVDWDVLLEVVNSGNAREQLAFFWNVMRHNTFSDIATEREFRDFAYRLREKEGRPSFCLVPRPREDPCTNSEGVKTLRPGWPFLSYTCPEYPVECNDVRARSGHTSAIKRFGMSSVYPAPSDREKRTCSKPRSRSMWWNVGSQVYQVTDNNQPSGYDSSEQQGFKLQAEGNGFTTLAGPSGSTAWIMAFAENVLALSSDELRMLRLALIGFMVPTEGHSVYETMVGSDGFGMDVGRWDAASWLSFAAEIHPRDVTLDLQSSIGLDGDTAFIDGAYSQHTFTREAFVAWLDKLDIRDPYSFVAQFRGVKAQFAKMFDLDLVRKANGDAAEEAIQAAKSMAKQDLGITYCAENLKRVKNWASGIEMSLGQRTGMSKCNGQKDWVRRLQQVRESASDFGAYRSRFWRGVQKKLEACRGEFVKNIEDGYKCLQSKLERVTMKPDSHRSSSDLFLSLEMISRTDNKNMGECATTRKNMKSDATNRWSMVHKACGGVFRVGSISGLEDKTPGTPAQALRQFYDRLLDVLNRDIDSNDCGLPYENIGPEGESEASQILDEVFAQQASDDSATVRCQRSLDARGRVLLSLFHRSLGVTSVKGFEFGDRTVPEFRFGSLVEFSTYGDKGVLIDGSRGVVIGGYFVEGDDDSMSDEGPVEDGSDAMCLVRPIGQPTQESILMPCSYLRAIEQPETKDGYDPVEKPPSSAMSVVGAETNWRIVDDTPICGYDKNKDTSGDLNEFVQTVLKQKKAVWARMNPVPLRTQLKWTLDTALRAVTTVQADVLKEYSVMTGLDSVRPGQSVDCQYGVAGGEKVWLPSRVTQVILGMPFARRRRMARAQARGETVEPTSSSYVVTLECTPLGPDHTGFDPDALPEWTKRTDPGQVRLLRDEAMVAPLGVQFTKQLGQDAIANANHEIGGVYWHTTKGENVRIEGVNYSVEEDGDYKRMRLLYSCKALSPKSDTEGKLFYAWEDFLENARTYAPQPPEDDSVSVGVLPEGYRRRRRRRRRRGLIDNDDELGVDK